MNDKKSDLKEIIRKLHEGEDPEIVKTKFGDLLRRTSAAEISMAEEELIHEGVPKEQIQKLCELHLAIFRESIEQNQLDVPIGHPIHILKEEHQILLSSAEALRNLVSTIRPTDAETITKELPRISQLVQVLKDSPNHYLREENVFFPYLEKHGITQPPAIMWTEHEQIREIESALYKHLDEYTEGVTKSFPEFVNHAATLAQLLSNHFYKENNVLFPTALTLFSEEEWSEIGAGFTEVGYCSFTPSISVSPPLTKTDEDMPTAAEGFVDLESGTMRADILQAIMNTLPVDITFVDTNDRVAYFSESPERIFVRSRAVIGRSVQLCHPQKSVHVVNRILDDFREGKRDKAKFWINLGGQMIYIRYFAVRNNHGVYLGCLEVSQNISEIKKIEGEKRLLDGP